MGHPTDADKLLEISRDELRPIIRNDPRLGPRELLLGSLQDQFHLGFGHRFLNVPVDNIPTVSVQYTAQVVKRPTKIQIRNVYMPMLMRPKRVHKPQTLLGGLLVPPPQETRLAEHSPNAGRTDRHDVPIQHHEGQPAVPLQRILLVKGDDGLLLPILQPKVPGNPPVMLVHFPIVAEPSIKLTGPHPQPGNELAPQDLCLLRPAIHKINYGITGIRRHPNAR